ncbi:MAG TPA: DUF3048 domain-containing protein [Anaerolineales bacterium]|nr:DUF3048 domain-containing protein [Anaerolineales bacterium]
MKKLLYLLALLSIVLSACGLAPAAATTPAASATATDAPTATDTPTATPTATLTFTPTPSYPPEGYGPSNFPAGVDPLTGLKVSNPALLQRRPMVIKVQNLPRDGRPQWGLSLADIVFEYYTEEGTTRFAAVFLGNDASIVGPIRSGRFIDADIVRGYKAMFAFGSAYVAEMKRFLNSEFANRLVLEGPSSPLTRYDPKGKNYLVVNTADLAAFATQRDLSKAQNLDNMLFKLQAPSGGQAVTQVYVRYSSAIYNRWDYDTASGKYMRFSDTVDASSGATGEQYAQLTDRLNGQPIAFDNVVVLYVNHQLYAPNIYDIQLSGSGDAYIFRDGQAYKVKWVRNDTDVVSLTNPDGSPFAFKPGNTMFEVIGLASSISQNGQSWRFTHNMP